MEYYSALKSKEPPDLCYNMDEPEDPMLSEINLSQKDKYCMVHLYEVPRGIKLIGAESRV